MGINNVKKNRRPFVVGARKNQLSGHVMKIELKPCPFCGCEADGPHYSDGYGDTYAPHYWVECSNNACAVSMEMPEPEIMIINAWNSRFSDV